MNKSPLLIFVLALCSILLINCRSCEPREVVCPIQDMDWMEVSEEFDVETQTKLSVELHTALEGDIQLLGRNLKGTGSLKLPESWEKIQKNKRRATVKVSQEFFENFRHLQASYCSIYMGIQDGIFEDEEIRKAAQKKLLDISGKFNTPDTEVWEPECIEHATQHFNRGDYASAIPFYNRLIESHPKNADYLERRGYCNFSIKKFSEAINDFSNAIQVKPDHFPLYFLRGNTYRKLEDYQGALSDYNEAILLNPEHGTAYYFRAKVKQHLGISPCEDFNSAVRLGNDSAKDEYEIYCPNQAAN